MYNIPMEYWNEGLSYLPSVVGVPLYADSATESRKRISYARVCVVIDVTKPLLDEFLIDIPNSNNLDLIQDEIPIKVSYQ